jgi:hypothetical protein
LRAEARTVLYVEANSIITIITGIITILIMDKTKITRIIIEDLLETYLALDLVDGCPISLLEWFEPEALSYLLVKPSSASERSFLS